jgi:4-hydroxyphenylpyruvate dioxygenase-like putative hemolysin
VRSEVVEFARSHPKSALHRALQWDDAKAAKAYRLIQANTLIVANLKFAHCS